jgi:hypothetical protein
MSNRSPKPRLSDLALVFSLAFGVHVSGGVDTAILIELGLAALWLIRPVAPRRPGLFIALLTILVVCLQYSCIVYVANGAVDPYYPLRFARAVVAFLGAFFAFSWIVRRGRLFVHDTWAYFSDIFVILATLESLVAFAEFASSPFRDFMYRYWINYPALRVSDFRALGFTTSAALPSYLHVVAFYIACEKLAHRRTAFPSSVVALMGIVSLAGTFLMAQTGVVILAASIVPFLMYTLRVGSLRILRYGGPIILLVSIAGMWYWQHVADDAQRERISTTVSVKTDAITNYVVYGEFSNASFEDLKSMYFLPSSRQIVFGNSLGLRVGNRLDPVDRRRLDTDVGYVTDLGGVGIVGTCISVSFYVVILVFALRCWIRGQPHYGSIILAFVTLCFLVGHAKEVHLFARSGLELYLFLLWAIQREAGGASARMPRARYTVLERRRRPQQRAARTVGDVEIDSATSEASQTAR